MSTKILYTGDQAKKDLLFILETNLFLCSTDKDIVFDGADIKANLHTRLRNNRKHVNNANEYHLLLTEIAVWIIRNNDLEVIVTEKQNKKHYNIKLSPFNGIYNIPRCLIRRVIPAYKNEPIKEFDKKLTPNIRHALDDIFPFWKYILQNYYSQNCNADIFLANKEESEQYINGTLSLAVLGDENSNGFLLNIFFDIRANSINEYSNGLLNGYSFNQHFHVNVCMSPWFKTTQPYIVKTPE